MTAAPALFPAPRVELPECAFVVHGEPVPCARARARIVTPRRGKPFIAFYDDPHSAAYKLVVAEVARAAMPPGWRPDWGWYDIRVRVYRRVQQGDWDNFGKTVGDACEGILWGNDKRARSGRVEMLDDLERPRLEVLAAMVGTLDIEADRKARARLLSARRKA